MGRNLVTVICLLATVAVAMNGPLRAAVPMNVIKGWQDNAPESLDITVLSADQTSAVRPYNAIPGGSVTTTNVTLRAKVDVVRRTASNLATEAEIVVQYVVQHYEPVAPPDGNYGTILGAKDRATAYLKNSHDNVFDLSCIVGCLVKL
jgi:hypothetical protein